MIAMHDKKKQKQKKKTKKKKNITTHQQENPSGPVYRSPDYQTSFISIGLSV